MTPGTIGAHVYWTRPRAADAPSLSELDRAVLAVSAVVWRARNGPVWLFTDRRGHEELAALGLLPLWDRVNVECLEGIPADVRAPAFWDLGKTIALDRLPPGGCVLDLDLIVWERLPPAASGTVSFLHWEAPAMPWYPGPDGLSVPPSYAFDPRIDWQSPVCNTAFLCCPDPRVRRSFLDAALGFARGNRPPGPGIAEMLFAGQRLLAHTLRTLAARPRPLIDYLYVPCGESRWLADPLPIEDPLSPDACESGVPFTHLWRHKHLLRDRPAAATSFRELLVRRCRERVESLVESDCRR